MWFILLSAPAIGIFAGIIYLVMRCIYAGENGSCYPGIEDVYPLEYEKSYIPGANRKI